MLRVFYILFLAIIVSGCQQNSSQGKPVSAGKYFETIQPQSEDHLGLIVGLSDALHLENRVGIGAPKYRVDRLVGKTRAEAIDLILSDLPTGRGSLDPTPEWLTHPNITFLDNSWRYCHRRSSQARIGDVETTWMNNILDSETPAHERLVLLFSNIFVSDYKTYRSAETYAQHHRIIRENAGGNMREFLLDVLQDPAILVYLNNDLNTRANINENLAREFLELFTLGEGNYSESDIRNLAYVFAGESVNPISQRYQRFSSAKSSLRRTVLGEEIKTPQEAVDLVLRQPAHAQFMARKFFREYVSLEPPSVAIIDQIAARYVAADYDISALLRATISSSEFWDVRNRLALVKDPIDIIFGSLRTLGYSNSSDFDARDFKAMLSRINFSLIDPPNVAGYQGGMSWVDGGLFTTRKKLLQTLMLGDKFRFGFDEAKRSFLENQRRQRLALDNYFDKLEELKSRAHPEQLIVEVATFQYVAEDMVKNRHPNISLNLVGVHLGGRSWDGMNIRLGLNRKHNYARVEFYENSCSPACISNFNEGWDSDWRGVRGFDVDPFSGGGPTRWLNNRWGSISGEDRLLLRRLFQLVHLVPDSVGNGQAFYRGSAENQGAWREWLGRQRSRVVFDDLRDESGNSVAPVILLGQEKSNVGLCSSVLSSTAHHSWFRPIDGVSIKLTTAMNRTEEWISKQLPADLLAPGSSSLEKLIAADAFQLK